MPIEFTHFLSGVAALSIIGLLFSRKLTHPLFYIWGVFTFMLPDIDHLATWKPYMITMILPTAWNDILRGLFIPREPELLHFWGFPSAIAAIALYGRHSNRKQWKYIAILALGWAVHLTLDGVMPL